MSNSSLIIFTSARHTILYDKLNIGATVQPCIKSGSVFLSREEGQSEGGLYIYKYVVMCTAEQGGCCRVL